MERSKRIYYRLEYAVVWPFLKLLRALPFQTRVRVGGRVLQFLIEKLPNTRKRIDRNLAQIFFDRSEQERANIRHQVAQTFGRTFIEILNNDTYTQHTSLFHADGPGLEAIANRDAGSGFILVSGHFGQWDAARQYLLSKGVEVGAVYRESNNPYFDKVFLKQIAYAGEPIFAKGRRGTTDMVRHVKTGGAVAILIDQKYSRGERLDFLGHPASTSTAAADMALKYGLPLIPVYGTRRADSLDIDIHFEAPIPHSDALTMMQAANDSLSARVRARPGQWYWLHKRWQQKGNKINPV